MYNSVSGITGQIRPSSSFSSTRLNPFSEHGHHFGSGPISEEVLTWWREQDSESERTGRVKMEDGGRNHIEGVKEEA